MNRITLRENSEAPTSLSSNDLRKSFENQFATSGECNGAHAREKCKNAMRSKSATSNPYTVGTRFYVKPPRPIASVNKRDSTQGLEAGAVRAASSDMKIAVQRAENFVRPEVLATDVRKAERKIEEFISNGDFKKEGLDEKPREIDFSGLKLREWPKLFSLHKNIEEEIISKIQHLMSVNVGNNICLLYDLSGFAEFTVKQLQEITQSKNWPKIEIAGLPEPVTLKFNVEPGRLHPRALMPEKKSEVLVRGLYANEKTADFKFTSMQSTQAVGKRDPYGKLEKISDGEFQEYRKIALRELQGHRKFLARDSMQYQAITKVINCLLFQENTTLDFSNLELLSWPPLPAFWAASEHAASHVLGHIHTIDIGNNYLLFHNVPKEWQKSLPTSNGFEKKIYILPGLPIIVCSNRSQYLY